MKLGTFEIPTEEIGDLWQLSGVLYDNGQQVIAMEIPFAEIKGLPFTVVRPTDEQWQAFLAQTDDPVTPVGKAFVRKATRQIDQSIVWRTYHRDNYTCVYCGATGVILTYDHYLAQKFGGQTTMENGRTSCRPCNKRKGHMTIDEWKTYATKHGLQTGEMDETLKTSEEWYKVLGEHYIILDPDGWDRKNYQYSYYEEKITRQEYERRAMNSTLLHEAQFGTFTTQDVKDEN